MKGREIAPKSIFSLTDASNIPVLIDWLLSDERQTLIEQSGYVRIN